VTSAYLSEACKHQCFWQHREIAGLPAPQMKFAGVEPQKAFIGKQINTVDTVEQDWLVVHPRFLIGSIVIPGWLEHEQNMGNHQPGQDQVEIIPNAASIERVGIDLAIFIYVKKLEQLVSCVVPMAATCAAWLQKPCRPCSI